MHSKHTILIVIMAMVLSVGMVGCKDDKSRLIAANSEKEANLIFVELLKANIDGVSIVSEKAQRKTEWIIMVPPEKLVEARCVLAEKNLPHDPGYTFEDMLGEGGLIRSQTEERARLMHAIAGELTKSLEECDRVVSARVHVNIPEKNPIQRDVEPPTAAVLIKYLPSGAGGDDWPIAPEDVKKLVANSIEGLQENPDNVSVVYIKSDASVMSVASIHAANAASNAPPVRSNKGLVAQIASDKSALQVVGGALVGLVVLGIGAGVLIRGLLLRRK